MWMDSGDVWCEYQMEEGFGASQDHQAEAPEEGKEESSDPEHHMGGSETTSAPSRRSRGEGLLVEVSQY